MRRQAWFNMGKNTLTYSKPQLHLIQDTLICIVKEYDKIADIEIFNNTLILADFMAWRTHALLAGYSVEHHSGRLYTKGVDGVKRYYK